MTSFLSSSRSRPFLLFTALAVASACAEGGDSPGPGVTGGAVLPGTTGGAALPGTTGGAATPGGIQPATTGGVQPGAAGGGNDVGVVATDGGVGASGNGLPCAVKKVVDAKCAATCHSDPPQGTFMALKTAAHFHVAGTSDKTKQYWELAKTRVGNGTMPPAAIATLTADEKTTLTTWLNQGAPASNETCAAEPDAGVPTNPGKVDTTGLECYRFLAHAQGDMKAKFKVGQVTDAYWNFGFKAPWTGMRYGLVVQPIIDNAKVLHHWLIYREDIKDGSITKTIGNHPGGELIHGWAPGGPAMDFRTHGDVGFELPDTSYSVEFHYNSSDPNAVDASGVELCAQKAQPKNVAGMTWLGYDQGGTLSYASGVCFDQATSWTGTCVPVSKDPIHLLFMNPHLHQTGRHLKSMIVGTDGKQRTLHDKPFDFNYQVSYETNEVLMPGEKIITSCTFSEPKCAGQSTTQEMCYLFTYAYPKYALIDNGTEGTFMHGKGVCLGQ
jgi:hypothetical protein